MMATQIRDSRLPLHATPAPAATIAPFLTFGEYTIMPMQVCSEEQIAQLFSKVCQRGNPVLQGRPQADLFLLGRAMYRKCMKSQTGNVAMHKGLPVALGCGWDMADGGAWAGSGFEMPASMAAHAACGKAAFDQFHERKRSGSTYFAAFYGVLPPHNVKLFGYCGFSNFCIAHKLGFQDSFQYTLIPALTGRGLFTEQDKNPEDTMNWPCRFADVPHADSEVRAELQQLDGNINLSLSSLEYIMTPEYQKMAGGICGMTGDQLFQPSDLIATNQLNWLRSQSSSQITARL